jgi:hypothetical protein
MTFFLLLVLPYVIGMALLLVAFASLRYLPVVAVLAGLLFALSWWLG